MNRCSNSGFRLHKSCIVCQSRSFSFSANRIWSRYQTSSLRKRRASVRGVLAMLLSSHSNGTRYRVYRTSQCVVLQPHPATIDVSGRACDKLDWLLTDERWKACGFDDINGFLATIDWSDFKLAAEQRKEISRKLLSIEASERQIARTLGVSRNTVRSDIGKTTVQTEPPPNSPTNENKNLGATTVQTEPPPTREVASGSQAQKDSEKKAPADTLSGDPEWYTPPEVIECARRAMGGAQTEPLSCQLDRLHHAARQTQESSFPLVSSTKSIREIGTIPTSWIHEDRSRSSAAS